MRKSISIFVIMVLTLMVYRAEKPEETRTFYKEEIESGVSVCIVSSRGRKERVLMDCEYDTSRFPYYFNKYTTYDDVYDIFHQFYMDKPVWEKTIHVDNPTRKYTLYYAQNIKYDGEDNEKAVGYEGHLWVLDEELGMVQVDEKRYREITERFFDAVERAVPSMTFEEVFYNVFNNEDKAS